MKSLQFNKIVIIESLGTGELKTGKRLCEDLDVVNYATDNPISIDYRVINNKNELFKLLDELIVDAIENSIYPALHFEIHGSSNKKGMILSANEMVTFAELKEKFIELNLNTRCNLLITLASCYGAYLIKIVQATDRAPFWGMVGPQDITYPDTIEKSFKKFYIELLENGDGIKAVKLLNSETPNYEKPYYFTTAEKLFYTVFRGYIRDYSNVKVLNTRARELRKRLKKEGINPLPSIGQIKRKIKREEPNSYEKYKNHFFMIDLYPDNKDRIIITYDNVTK